MSCHKPVLSDTGSREMPYQLDNFVKIPSPALPPPLDTQNKRVLVALSTFERVHLLAERSSSLSSLAGVNAHAYLCDAVDNLEWERTLRATRPEVLVVAWAVPILPAGYLDEPACPVRYICFLTGSVRRIVTRSFIERGGLITNWGDEAAPMVAEHALLLLLAALRRLSEWRPFINLPAARQIARPINLVTKTLHNRTVSIHGFGRIARQLIHLLAPFNVKVRTFSAGVPPEFIRAHGAEPVASLAQLFAGAEIVVECEALTPQTLGSVDQDLIAQLATGAIFVNVGRGEVVNEAALARRAATGEIYLALDVLTVEPLPLDSPLRDIPGAIISPHIGGPTHDRFADLGERALANITRYLRDEPLRDLITPEIFDRST